MTEFFNINQFFLDIINEPTIVGIVGVYNLKPAIAENFDRMPDVKYITLCDQGQTHEYCNPLSRQVRLGKFELFLRIVGVESTSRSELRSMYEVVHEFLMKYNKNDVYKVELHGMSNNLLDPTTDRPYYSCIYTVFFHK